LIVAAWYDPPAQHPKPGVDPAVWRGIVFGLVATFLLAAVIAGMILLATLLAPLMDAL
jgi:hypothetical protein